MLPLGNVPSDEEQSRVVFGSMGEGLGDPPKGQRKETSREPLARALLPGACFDDSNASHRTKEVSKRVLGIRITPRWQGKRELGADGVN